MLAVHLFTVITSYLTELCDATDDNGLILLWSPYVIRQTIIFLPCDFYLLSFFFPFFFPRLISAVGDWMSTILPHMVRLPENTGRKKSRQNRHLGTIAQLCRVISSQLRHVSTIRKNLLSSNMSSTCLHNMVNFGLLAAEIDTVV